ncbi:MAG: hypothetical protein GF405_02475 [Candidatus Eisenbacteria bacterium]|nr:hypothetical protein [Candidatus Eisenbacteria bacterium]
MYGRAQLLLAMTVLVTAAVLGGCGGGGTVGRDITIDTPVEIDRTFDVGDVLSYRFKESTQAGVKMTSFEQTVSMQTEFRTTNTITESTDEEIELGMRFDYAVGSVASGDQVMPNSDVNSMRGKELIVTLSPDGEVKSLTGLAGEAYLEEGTGQFKVLVDYLVPPLPTEAVEIGSSWTEELDPADISGLDQEYIGETVYTVTGFKETYEVQCVEVSFTASFEYEGRFEQGDDVWLVSGVGGGEGTMLIAIDGGHLVHARMDIEQDMTGEGSAVASAAASGEFSAGIKTRFEIEVL